MVLIPLIWPDSNPVNNCILCTMASVSERGDMDSEHLITLCRVNSIKWVDNKRVIITMLIKRARSCRVDKHGSIDQTRCRVSSLIC